jgi:hypothetical protein
VTEFGMDEEKYCRSHAVKMKLTGALSVNIVPYNEKYAPEDLCEIARAVVEATPQWRHPSKRESLLAAVLAAGHCWTALGVKTIGLPPVPWTLKFEKAVTSRLMKAARRGDLIFNTRFTSICCNTFPQSGNPAQKVQEFVAKIRDCSRVAAIAVANARIRCGKRPEDFFEDIAHAGMPQRGYQMHLAQCLWMYGGIATDGVQLFPADTLVFDYHSQQSGTCEGIARLTGDTDKSLRDSPELQSLRLEVISHEVGKRWKSHGFNRHRLSLNLIQPMLF